MINKVLKKYNLIPKKSRDQYFLKNPEILRFECEQAEISEKDVVLEIGAGIGNLTKEISQRAKKVYAVEKDRKLVGILKEQLKDFHNIEIIQNDILKIDLPDFDKCVSNIPYSLSSKITEILAKKDKLSVICYQKDFAQRLIAQPGEKNYSRISVLSNFYFTPVFLREIPREEFFPEPEVDSAIIKFFPKSREYKVDENLFFKVVKALFIHKNKKVKNSFYNSRHFFDLNKGKANEIAENLPYKDKKVITLSIEQLIKISDFLGSENKYN